MKFTITSTQFDVAASALAIISHVRGWDSGETTTASLASGLQFFCIASCVDRIVRIALVNGARNSEPPITTAMKNAVIEESIYAGILLTTGKMAMIPRLGAALALGITAARGLLDLPSVTSNETLTLDSKIGLVWTVAREALLTILPRSYSQVLLAGADSAIFALVELTPNANSTSIPRFSRPWLYKAISSVFFRGIANTAALHYGITASLTQHLLFNISRSLP